MASSSSSNVLLTGKLKRLALPLHPLCAHGPQFKIHYWAYGDTDTVAVYFAKAVPGLIDYSSDIAPGVLADYTAQDRIVSIDLNSASMDTVCHMYDTRASVDARLPLSLEWEYDGVHDAVTVYLAGAAHPSSHAARTEDPHIWIGLSDSGRWSGLLIKDATKSLHT